MIKTVLELGQERINKFIEKALEKFDEWDDLYYTLQYLLDKNDYANAYVVIDENDEICDFINSSRTYGIVTLCPYFIEGTNYFENTFREIKEYFVDKKVLIYTHGIDISKYGLTSCNIHSSLDLEHKYDVDHGIHSVIKENDINLLRDAIEDFHFPTLDIKEENVSFELIHGEDVNNSFIVNDTHDYPIWINRSNHRNIIGFHYLQPDFYDCHSLLVAKCNGVMIGCIKYGRYSMDDKYRHYGLNYIDINMKYRRKGIAKMLIEEFARILDDDMPLVLSDESDMGKICQMAKHFKEANFKTKVYAYGERY